MFQLGRHSGFGRSFGFSIPIGNITWTQLGNIVSTNSGSIVDSTYDLTVGQVPQMSPSYSFTAGTLTAMSGSATITFTRSNTATVVNSLGYITSVSANTPRYDYDPVTLKCKGLLVEMGRQNLMLNSGNFGDSFYSKLNGPLGFSGNTNVAPDGTTTASLLTDNTTTYAWLEPSGAITAATGVPQVLSVFIKKDSVPRATRFPGLRLLFNPSGSYDYFDIYLDTSTGESTSVYGGSNVSNVHYLGSGVVDFNTYWRCWIAGYTNTPSTGQVKMQLFPAIGAGNSWTTNANAQGNIVAWGAQLETRSYTDDSMNQPTSYIPALTSAGVRGNDDVQITSIGSFFNANTGTFYIEAVSATPPNSNIATKSKVFSASDGTASNRFDLYLNNTTGNSNAMVVSSGTTHFDVDSNVVYGNGNIVTFTLAYEANNCGFSVDSGNVITESTVTLPTGISTFYIGSAGYSGANAEPYFNGHIRKFYYFNTRIPDADLPTLSGGVFPSSAMAWANGSVYLVDLYSGFSDSGGTKEAEFNGNNITPGANSYTSGTGETWTLHQSGSPSAAFNSGYASLPGSANNYISTPDSAATSVTGNIDIYGRYAATTVPLTSSPGLVFKDGAYQVHLKTDGTIQARFYQNSRDVIFATSTTSAGFVSGTPKYWRVTRDSTSGNVTFYTGT